MVEGTQYQRFPTIIINHYQKWVKFEATRDNSYVRPIMEGGGRIEVSPLPYVLEARVVREERESSPGITTQKTEQGDFFLFRKKKLQESDEEFDRVPVLVHKPLALVAMRRKRKEQGQQPPPSPVSERGQTSGAASTAQPVLNMPAIVTTVKDTWFGQEVREGLTQLV